MKKIDIQNAVNAFGRIPVNKVKNDKIRSTLIFDYRRLRKVSREIEQERSDLVEKFRDDFAEELLDVQVLRESGKPVTDHDEFLRAEASMNRTIQKMFQEEVTEDLELVTVTMDDFEKAVKDGEYTFEDLAALDGIIID
jgi:hypothetical protein